MKNATTEEISGLGFKKSSLYGLLAGLGKTAADAEPLPLVKVLEICGQQDVLWCIDRVLQLDQRIKLASRLAREVEHLKAISASVDTLLTAGDRYAAGGYARSSARYAAAGLTEAAAEAAAYALFAFAKSEGGLETAGDANEAALLKQEEILKIFLSESD